VNEEISKGIMETLKQSRFGLTILEIAEKTNYSRNTIAKYLEVMEAKSEIFFRQIGVYRIWFSLDGIEKEFRKGQEKYNEYFLLSLSNVLKITQKQAKEIGKEIAKKMVEETHIEIPKIETFQDLLEGIIILLELGDQIKTEIIEVKTNEAILRMHRPEGSTDPKLDWMYIVEASTWKNILHHFGYADVEVEISEISKEYAYFKITKNN
jgi:transcriptional regulator with XRE-family HTH domain